MGKEEINQKDIMTHLDSTTKQYSKCISFFARPLRASSYGCSLIPLHLWHRCLVLSRPGHHKKRLLNLSEMREAGKAR